MRAPADLGAMTSDPVRKVGTWVQLGHGLKACLLPFGDGGLSAGSSWASAAWWTTPRAGPTRSAG